MIVEPLDVVAVVAGIASVVPILRRGPWQGWAIVGAYAVAFGAAGFLPMPIAADVKILMIAIYAVLVLAFPHVLLRLSREEATFHEELAAIMASIKKPLARWRVDRSEGRHDGRREVSQAVSAGLARWSSLSPPTERWRETYRLAGEYLDAVHTTATVPGLAGKEASDRADALVSQVEAAWRASFRKASR